MKKKNYTYRLALSAVLLFVSSFIVLSYAEIKLPAIVSSNMVLQRNAEVKLWGWAKANEKISISTSWIKETKKLQADDNGYWSVKLKTTNSKAPQTINITSKESEIKLDNVLFGEVWLCSGQSNMKQPLKGYNGQPTFGGQMAIVKADNDNLRLFSVDRKGSKQPLADVEKFSGWQSASSANVGDFSAVAYFFGQQLQEKLDVPVGLIHTSWGGSSVQAWISDEVMNVYDTVNIDEIDINKRTNRIPTALFNGMINPLTSYAIKGVLWYQGESNRNEPENYQKLLPAMVNDWRARWGQGDFPFYFVQIAPFMYGNNNDVFNTVENSAFIREAQFNCVNLIPNSGIAITMDIGDDYCIHPPMKKEVADRLLFNALNKTYGYETIDCEGPVFDKFTEHKGGLLIDFKHAEMGVFAYDELEGFELAGEDRVFYPAVATVFKRKQVLVKSDSVPKPIAVRYAWRNWVKGTLYDTNLLPASSFRTDNWSDATNSQ